MKYLKIVLQTAACAGSVYGICFSSVLVHPLMILVFLASIALLYAFARLAALYRVSWLVIVIGLLLGGGLFSPIVILHPFLDQGFDDGPFYGKQLNSDFHILTPSYEAPYLFGRILFFNRDTLSPVMIFQNAFGQQKWAIEMSVDQFAGAHLSSIRDPKVIYGTFRDRINFSATWTGGAERGYAYIWKFGGFQKFNLSW